VAAQEVDGLRDLIVDLPAWVQIFVTVVVVVAPAIALVAPVLRRTAVSAGAGATAAATLPAVEGVTLTVQTLAAGLTMAGSQIESAKRDARAAVARADGIERQLTRLCELILACELEPPPEGVEELNAAARRVVDRDRAFYTAR
jgi:hypothetical protein